jgi:ABC-2 type transport system permease protein
MRNILTMAIKDLTLMRRDWLGMFFIIGFPVLMGVFFGLIAGSFAGGDGGSLEIAVVDKDNSEMSKSFVESLKKNTRVDVRSLPEQEALDQVRRGNLVGVVIIPRKFGETAGIFWAQDRPAIQIGVDPSRQAEAGMLNGLVMQASGELMADRFRDPASMRPFVKQSQEQFTDDENVPPSLRPILAQMMGSLDEFMESLEKVKQQAKDGEDGGGMPAMQFAKVETIDVTRKPAEGSSEALEQKIRSKWDISFPQAMMWGVLGSAAAFAITMVRERRQGTFLRLQVAPITRGHVLAGKAAACGATVLCVIVFLLILGILLGMRPRSPALLALAAVCVAYCFVGVMMLMSVIGKSEEAVSGAAWGANIVMAMFGGGMIPLAFMPEFMKTISHLSPVKWGILALEGAIWREFTLSEMLPPCSVLVGAGTACLAIGVFVLSRAKG